MDDFLKAVSKSYPYVMRHCPRQTVIDYRILNQDGINMILRQWDLEDDLDVETISKYHHLHCAIVADPPSDRREEFLSKSWLPTILLPHKDRVLCLLAHSHHCGTLLSAHI